MARKKKSLLKPLLKILLVLLIVAFAFYVLINLFSQPPHIKYPAFGINIPPGFKIHGIDVSRYQRSIDWGDVKEMQVKNIKIGFVFIKATEGINNVDEQFRRNWLNAEEEEMPKGAYHFFIAGKSGKLQAKNFIEIVKLKTGDLPPVLDVEQSYGKSAGDIKEGVANWLFEVENYYQVKPIIYTNIDFYNHFLKGTFDDYPFWIAHYLQPDKPRIERNWLFWQHSENGHVNGIRTQVDFNVFSGDSSDFKNLLIK